MKYSNKNRIVVGAKVNYLTYINHIEKRYGLFLCECGTTKKIKIDHVFAGKTKSCSCKLAELVSKARTKYGVRENGKQTSEYNIWKSMRQRCNNPKSKSWSRYGGRGIKITPRWDEFHIFLNDMGRRPSKYHTLDRVNNDGDYSPENCRWATREEQANNTSKVNKYEYNGKIVTVSELSKIFGVNKDAIKSYIVRKGIHDAIVYYSSQSLGKVSKSVEAAIALSNASLSKSGTSVIFK